MAQIAPPENSFPGKVIAAEDYKNAPLDAVEIDYDPSIGNSFADFNFMDDLQPGELIIYKTLVYLPKNPASFLMRAIWCLFTCGLSYVSRYYMQCFPKFFDLKRTQLAVTSHGRLIFWENAQVGMEMPACNYLSCICCCFSYWFCTKKTMCTSCCKTPWCAPPKNYKIETKYKFASVKDISVIRHEYDTEAWSVFPQWTWRSVCLACPVYGCFVFANIVRVCFLACCPWCIRQNFNTNLSVYFKYFPLNGSMDKYGSAHPRKVKLSQWDSVGAVIGEKWGAKWIYNLKADLGAMLATNPISTIGDAEKEIITCLIAAISFITFILGLVQMGLDQAVNISLSQGLNDDCPKWGIKEVDDIENAPIDPNNDGTYWLEVFRIGEGPCEASVIVGMINEYLGTLGSLLIAGAASLVVLVGVCEDLEDPIPYMIIKADNDLYAYTEEKNGKPFARKATPDNAFEELHKLNTLLTSLANQCKEATVVRECPAEWIANPWEVVLGDEFGRHPRHIPSIDGGDGDTVKLSIANLPIDPNEKIINVQRLGTVWNWKDWCYTCMSIGCHFLCNYNKRMAETTLLVLTDKRIMEVYTKSKSDFRKKTSNLCCGISEWDQTVTTYYFGDTIPSGYISRSLETPSDGAVEFYKVTAGLQTSNGGLEVSISAPKRSTWDLICNPLCSKVFCQQNTFSEMNPVKWEGFIKSISLSATEFTVGVPSGFPLPNPDEMPPTFTSMVPYSPAYETYISYLQSEKIIPFCTKLMLNCIWFCKCGLAPKLSRTEVGVTTKRTYFISTKTNDPWKCWKTMCKVDMLSKDDYTVGWVENAEIQMTSLVAGAERNETLFSRMGCGGLGSSHAVLEFAFENLKPVWFSIDWLGKSLGPLDREKVITMRKALSLINFSKNSQSGGMIIPSFIATQMAPTPVVASVVTGQVMERDEKGVEMI
jgi:hypothetical protein